MYYNFKITKTFTKSIKKDLSRNQCCQSITIVSIVGISILNKVQPRYNKAEGN